MIKSADNPGTFARGKVGFANGSAEWSEEVDAVASLESSLRRRGYSPMQEGDAIILPESELSLLPLVVGGINPRPEGGVRTTTTIELAHPSLFPTPVFEFQHAAGPTTAGSLEQGFNQFVELDLVPILEALSPTPARCHSISRSFPATGLMSARARRVVFGPVAGRGALHAAPSPDDHAPLCPCCMLMTSFEAFEPLLAGDMTAALRLYALRSADGQPQADCRLNGMPFEAGADALRRHAASWRGTGFAFRKQYVIVHTLLQ
jgi:hypothetical protein